MTKDLKTIDELKLETAMAMAVDESSVMSD